MRWYLSRLASMRPAEVVWRARSAATLPRRLGPLEKQPGRADCPLERRCSPAPTQSTCIAAVRRWSTFTVFDLEFPLGFEFDWHRDYRNGRQVERGFATALNIRDTAAVSDIKYVWEPSRLQHFPPLAFAANGKEQARTISCGRSIPGCNANPCLSRRELDQQPGTGRARNLLGPLVPAHCPDMSRAIRISAVAGWTRSTCTSPGLRAN